MKKMCHRKLFQFHSLHHGRAVVVCGCGESLNDLVAPERCVTIGVNDVGRRFQPDYLVVVNPRSQFTGDRFRYVETSKARALFTHLDLGVSTRTSYASGSAAAAAPTFPMRTCSTTPRTHPMSPSASPCTWARHGSA